MRRKKLFVASSIAFRKKEMAPGYLGEFRIDGADLAILVNGKNIAFLKGLNTTLADDDNVVIMPFMDGG